uniref:p12-6p n=1 Tax=Pyrococcus sp. 12/1 TaxID=758582 RepID=D6MY12_9EURY|nr:p12-6p [Pyrococcus sp. 12/1]
MKARTNPLLRWPFIPAVGPGNRGEVFTASPCSCIFVLDVYICFSRIAAFQPYMRFPHILWASFFLGCLFCVGQPTCYYSRIYEKISY